MPWLDFSICQKDVENLTLLNSTSIMGHLLVVGEFVVVSHLKIFPLQLLGPADKPMAGPSSSKGKILRWDTFQISGGKFNCPI